jgi:pimeloyl-ACP methyl ester carboxylesterase
MRVHSHELEETTMSTTVNATVPVAGIGPVAVTATDRGTGPVFLLLHGGAGPQSVDGFADLLADTAHVRVIAPVHPGFGGTPRPEALTTVRELAALYVGLLSELDLTGVTVVGNSIGGWLAAEIGVLGSPRVAGLVLVDAAGIQVDGHSIPDFFSLTLDQVADLSYHDPDSFRIDPATMPPALLAALPGNRAALAVYGGSSMVDPTLADRLPAITVPTLVVWGDADRMIDAEFGRAYAAAIPGARFELLPDTGHVPQIETPDQLLDAIMDFARQHTMSTAIVAIVGPGDGELMLSGPTTLRILEDGSNTGHRIGMAEIVIAPHTGGPMQHRHARHDEGFYVVSGTARFTVGTTSHDAPAGTLVMVPPGAPHTFANPTDEPVVMVNTFTPDLYVGYFRELRDMIAAAGSLSEAAVVEAMSHYATEPATDFAP